MIRWYTYPLRLFRAQRDTERSMVWCFPDVLDRWRHVVRWFNYREIHEFAMGREYCCKAHGFVPWRTLYRDGSRDFGCGN